MHEARGRAKNNGVLSFRKGESGQERKHSKEHEGGS